MQTARTGDATPLAGLTPPDGTGQYHPLIRLDHLWRIHGENAPTRWLLGQSVVGRHLLDLFFDPNLARLLHNRDQVAPIAARYFSLATTPFHTLPHPEYVTFTQVMAELFGRYPELGALYQQAPEQEAPLLLPSSTGEAFTTKTLEFTGPAGTVLRFFNMNQRQSPRHATEPAHSQGVLVPANALTETGLILLHVTHNSAAREGIGATTEAVRRWWQALLRTIQERLASRLVDGPWDPIGHLQGELAAASGDAAAADPAAELASFPVEIQDLIRGAVLDLAAEVPQLGSLVAAAGSAAPATMPATTLWHPFEPFPLVAVSAALGPPDETVRAHPAFGAGYVWRLGDPDGWPTQLAIFPERRLARWWRPAGELGPANGELVLDLLIVETHREPRLLHLVSLAAGWGELACISASGELDLTSRRLTSAADPLTWWEIVTARRPAVPAAAAAARPPVPVVEAAARLGYHPTHIKTLIRTGKLKGAKLGRNWFVDPDSLEAFAAPRQRRSRVID